ncbi:putative tyrosinase [Triangularia setosa]|uniref:Tyrosinase n=1 Tax=Triangularia setosa TaxID=2587417 RepID=A0AAN6WF69_9PEZI|nr:putative tyrosinase [Podospora setosa]
MRRNASLCVAAVALPWAAARSTTPASSPPLSPSSSPALASATPIPVVGVKTGIDKVTGKPPARLNINGLWAKGGAQWNLYILALSELQTLNETDESSYFAIAGIHGFPHSAWNGVGHVDGAPSNTGFCPHGELLFTTWHRPYVALYEQLLVARAVEIASRYPPDMLPEYMAAAESLRQPYWDWAMNPTLPPAATRINMTVRAPEGLKTIPNPLYSYVYQRPEVQQGFGGWLTSRPQTFRCLGSGGVLNNATESNDGLLLSARDLTGSVYDIFTRVNTFDGMRSSSFENPHNLIHIRSACNGTMSDINWSAFEPLFMLHHCNVDRLVAMWQTIYYKNSMFTGNSSSSGQFGTPKGTVITADSPLKPFFRGPSATNDNTTAGGPLEFHTSNTVANISVFGYTYPELPDWNLPAETRAGQVRAKVNALYGDKAGDDGATTLDTGPLNRMGKGKIMDYWMVEMSVERGDLAGLLPATVSLFIKGEVIGRVSLLGMPCEGVERQEVPVQDVKVGNGTLKDVDRGSVVEYLEKEVKVGVTGADGSEIPVANVPSLGVVVLDMEYSPRTNESSFPAFNGKVTRWPVELRQNLGMNKRRRRTVVRLK